MLSFTSYLPVCVFAPFLDVSEVKLTDIESMAASHHNDAALTILRGDQPSTFSSATRATQNEHVWFSVKFRKPLCVGCFRLRSVQVRLNQSIEEGY